MLSGFAVFSTVLGRTIGTTDEWRAGRWSDEDSVTKAAWRATVNAPNLSLWGAVLLPGNHVFTSSQSA